MIENLGQVVDSSMGESRENEAVIKALLILHGEINKWIADLQPKVKDDLDRGRIAGTPRRRVPDQ